MQHKNLPIFTYLNSQNITAIIYRSRLFIATLFAILLLASSCKKAKPPAYIANVYEQYFETNILNRDFRVALATDNGTDLTSQYTGYTFRLLKNTYYDGPMTAVRSGANPVTYTGTWNCNEDFSKLVISITQPAIPADFNFINRPWRFTKKAFPIMELAPWGTTDPKVLHMERL
jgi:hypothetical protein